MRIYNKRLLDFFELVCVEAHGTKFCKFQRMFVDGRLGVCSVVLSNSRSGHSDYVEAVVVAAYYLCSGRSGRLL